MESKDYRVSWAISSFLKYGEMTLDEYIEEFGMVRGSAKNDMQDVIRMIYDLYGGHVRYSKSNKCYVLDDRDEVVRDLI